MSWSALMAVVALSVSIHQGGALELSNPRPTHGLLGPVRTATAIIPGDSLFVCFDINGIAVDDAGRVAYSIATELSDRSGKVLFRQEPREMQATVSLGGSQVPAYAELRIGLDQEPGEFLFTVKVADRTNNRSNSLSLPVTVLKKGFGLVRLTTTSDQEGLLPVPVAGVGQPLWVQYAAVGFARDQANKQPNVSFAIRVLDEAGKPTVAKPMTSSVNKDVPEKFLALPMNFLLSLNRPGKFTVEISATDNLGKQTAQVSFPLTVQPVK